MPEVVPGLKLFWTSLHGPFLFSIKCFYFLPVADNLLFLNLWKRESIPRKNVLYQSIDHRSTCKQKYGTDRATMPNRLPWKTRNFMKPNLFILSGNITLAFWCMRASKNFRLGGGGGGGVSRLDCQKTALTTFIFSIQLI